MLTYVRMKTSDTRQLQRRSMMDRRILAVFAALVLAVSAGFAQEPEELTVFCAASLTGAFTELGQMYENETNIDVVFNFDGSQVLHTQVENGAYADIFVSANKKQLNALKDEGLMNNSTISVFTTNKPALIVPKDNPAQIQNISDLAKPGLKIVIGTKDVPIGDYTLQILDKLANDTAYGPKFKEDVMANVVSNETNVNYIVSKIALGEADVGIAYKSDVTKEMAAKITKIEIPDKYNVIAEYPMGILKQSRYPAEAEEFVNLVKSEEGRAVLAKYGFDPV
jgi:molybdate transport system substrate-binding protein